MINNAISLRKDTLSVTAYAVPAPCRGPRPFCPRCGHFPRYRGNQPPKGERDNLSLWERCQPERAEVEGKKLKLLSLPKMTNVTNLMALILARQPVSLYNKTASFETVFGTPEGIRIPDLPLRRRTLYPAELLGHM